MLVVSPFGGIFKSVLVPAFPNSPIRSVGTPAEVRQAVASGLRSDIVIADLTWTGHPLEYVFDGLDALEILRRKDGQVPVIFTAQGHSAEQDHIDEAVEQPGVAGICPKAFGSGLLVHAVEVALRGSRLVGPDFPLSASPPTIARIHQYFNSRRGETAARMAGAIASGNAIDHRTLAKAAGIKYPTATKVVNYLSPLIKARDEYPPDLSMTQHVVYRWCGLHARYIISWSRRRGRSIADGRVSG
jgi:DNA-binding NarL/FixJ family response regulator